ncbi:hypothetical protein HK101_003283 [Irineochytrium annulatum]|nr:hypothetical protein HK101_003283 [Irineochytrium annulatum]
MTSTSTTTAPSAQPRIVILGAGLIGSYVGAALATSPAPFPPHVTFVGRSSFTTKVRNAGGLTVTMRTNAASQPKTRHATPESFTVVGSVKELVDQGLKPDVLLVTVKRTATGAVADELRAAGFTAEAQEAEGEGWFWAKTTVVAMQNGTRSAAAMLERLGESLDIIDGMWPFNVVETQEGHFHQGSVGPVYIADSEKGRMLLKVLLAAGVDCKVSPDMDNVLYGKLLANLNNAICALSGMPLKAELSKVQYRSVLSRCVQEALATYTVAGINPVSFTAVPAWMMPYVLSMPDFLFTRLAASTLAIDEKATSSMYEDLKHKRPTEIEFLQGEISRLGREHHVPTPVCDRVVELIRSVEKKAEGIVPHTGEQIMDCLELL